MLKLSLFFLTVFTTFLYAESNSKTVLINCIDNLMTEFKSDSNPFIQDYAKDLEEIRSSTGLVMSDSVKKLNEIIAEVAELRESSLPSLKVKSFANAFKLGASDTKIQNIIANAYSETVPTLLAKNTSGLTELIGSLNTSCRGIHESTDKLVEATLDRLKTTNLLNVAIIKKLETVLKENMATELFTTTFPFDNAEKAEWRMTGYIIAKIHSLRLEAAKENLQDKWIAHVESSRTDTNATH